MTDELDRLKKLAGLNEAADTEERWKRNVISVGPKMALVVQITAAEANGWRTDVGFSKGGKVIEDPAYSLKSDWVATYEAAEKAAKTYARKFKIKWKPVPYGKR